MKLPYLLFCFILASCGNANKLVYFNNLSNQLEYSEKISTIVESKIQPDDLLSISVSSLSPEANIPFNGGGTPIIGNDNTGSSLNEGYLVDKEGFIDYPVLGRIKLGGLSKEEAKLKLTMELKFYLKEPIIRIRYLNYRITVVGEVNRPSTFTIPSERINIIEALGMAGDMTVFGKRNNVLIIREEGGLRKAVRVNLNGKEVLNSPYFYLKQNDMVYVEPIRAKAVQTTTFRNDFAFALSIVSVIAVILLRF